MGNRCRSYSSSVPRRVKTPGQEQTSPLNVRRIGEVAMAGKPALASVPVTQEPYRNRDCEDSRAHSFCHAKYTHVSQTLWRGLPRDPLKALEAAWRARKALR